MSPFAARTSLWGGRGDFRGNADDWRDHRVRSQPFDVRGRSMDGNRQTTESMKWSLPRSSTAKKAMPTLPEWVKDLERSAFCHIHCQFPIYDVRGGHLQERDSLETSNLGHKTELRQPVVDYRV